MKERPILFSGPMVRAILEGRKTQTRRVVKPQPYNHKFGYKLMRGIGYVNLAMQSRQTIASRYGWPGNRLWVRETWAHCAECGSLNFAATVNKPRNCSACDKTIGPWKPSIHIVRADSRITLEVTAVRVERLHDITEADAIAEGIHKFHGLELYGCDPKGTPGTMVGGTASEAFAILWDSINDKRGFGWDKNPWVWVVEFERVAQQ